MDKFVFEVHSTVKSESFLERLLSLDLKRNMERVGSVLDVLGFVLAEPVDACHVNGRGSYGLSVYVKGNTQVIIHYYSHNPVMLNRYPGKLENNNLNKTLEQLKKFKPY